MLTNSHWREWTGIALAIVTGPAFVQIGYAIPGLVFGASAAFYFASCVIVVPLVTLVASRWRFLAWQLAIVSLSMTILVHNIRLRAIHRSEIPSVVYVLWGLGTLLSSPLPIYYLLRPMAARQRYLAGITIAIAAFVLWLGIRRITR